MNILRLDERERERVWRERERERERERRGKNIKRESCKLILISYFIAAAVGDSLSTSQYFPAQLHCIYVRSIFNPEP